MEYLNAVNRVINELLETEGCLAINYINHENSERIIEFLRAGKFFALVDEIEYKTKDYGYISIRLYNYNGNIHCNSLGSSRYTESFLTDICHDFNGPFKILTVEEFFEQYLDARSFQINSDEIINLLLT